jgi:hypothetical protein
MQAIGERRCATRSAKRKLMLRREPDEATPVLVTSRRRAANRQAQRNPTESRNVHGFIQLYDAASVKNRMYRPIRSVIMVARRRGNKDGPRINGAGAVILNSYRLEVPRRAFAPRLCRVDKFGPNLDP